MKLSNKENLYWAMSKVNSGVLYLKGKPGIAKTAIIESISKKLGYAFFDLRLSQMDESDLGIPKLEKMKVGESEQWVQKKALPDWAISANQTPTIIAFEELNRCSQNIQNAALGILLERRIDRFKFNDNVHFIATGNLGEDDGTEVEEFDRALNNRLIHFNHDLSIDEWMEWAIPAGVHDTVIGFVKSNPEYFYKYQENSDAYASPRSWTFVSDFLNSDKNNKSIIPNIISSYVGTGAGTKFIKYLSEYSQHNIQDVLDGYNDISKDLEKSGIEKYSELLEEFKNTQSIHALNVKQSKNFIAFLKDSRIDQVVGLFNEIVSTYTDKDFDDLKEHHIAIFKSFPEVKDILSKNS